LVLLFVTVRASVWTPRSNRNSPLFQIASAYTGVLALGVLELGVHDLPVHQVDLALERPVGQVEDAGLPADAHQLHDVGQVQLGEGALEGHGRGARSVPLRLLERTDLTA
jgi:hypothetical protein